MSQSAAKKGAILTTTRNSSHIWKYFVRSFSDYASGDYDLYVWDNGSRAGDIEYLQTYVADGTIKAFFSAGANLLFTEAANGLLRMGHEDGHKQLLIINPDIEFREGWDRDVESNRGILGFVLVKPNGLLEHCGGIGKGDHAGRGERDMGQYSETRDVSWVTFGAVCISRGCYEQLGELDRNYPHFGSDREYCALAKSKGIPVRCSGARLTHSFGKSTRPYIWRDIPDDIWKRHVKERKDAGVHFPDDQSRCARLDSPGRYLDFKSGRVVG